MKHRIVDFTENFENNVVNYVIINEDVRVQLNFLKHCSERFCH